jgi:sugar O-acyltransferase (sialic acid O-acetyltransferase NeuD family)
MLKRAIDILLSLIAIVLLLPLMIIVSVLVYFKLGSPIFFTQERPGLNEKIFKMIKFRSMLNSTDKNEKLLSDEERLTSFGKTLRSTSLDELPGLLNVLKGDMSIVGPRPLLVDYLPLYNYRQSKRHNVRPGITGWAQVNGRNAISWEEKFELDVWYIENQCLSLDLKIIFMTVGKVFKRTGISSDQSVTMERFTGTSKGGLCVKDVLIIGAGGFAREVAWLIEDINYKNESWNLIGYLDENLNNKGHLLNGYEVLGDFNDFKEHNKEIYYVCAVGDTSIRKELSKKAENIGLKPATLVHPSVIISKYVKIGEGTMICASSIITVNVEIGKHVIINLDCTIGHDVVIADYVTILPSVNISGAVLLEEGSNLGTGTAIIQGKKVGANSIIGAGSVVVKDIPENCTAVGVPAKVVKFNQ